MNAPFVSQWQAPFQSFKKLEKEWGLGLPEEVVRYCLSAILTSSKNRAYWEVQFRGGGLNILTESQWNEIKQLRAEVYDMRSGWHSEDPLDDVYHAALRMLSFTGWQSNHSKDKIFRGQRCHNWNVMPTLFRGSPKKHEVDTQIALTQGYVRALMKKKVDLDKQECVGVLQHYSSEISVKTWLLDFTWDPFIALFFASNGGETGDIGAISYISIDEWNHLSSEGSNPLGPICIYEPPNVPRLNAQAGLFIDSSHPDLFDQLVVNTLYFRQHSGLVFEDKEHEKPISASSIFPTEDKYLGIIRSLKPLIHEGDNFPTPHGDSGSNLTGTHYFDIAKSWIDDSTSKEDDVLRGLAEIHSRLQVYKDSLDVTLRSMHRLRDAVHWVRDQNSNNLRQAMYLSLTRSASKKEKEILESVVNEVETLFC